MRAVSLWRPFRTAPLIHDEVDGIFARFFGDEDWQTRPTERHFLPAAETYVRDGELTVRVDLPGIDPKDVELSVEGGRLSIKGERKENQERKQDGRRYREVNYGRFERFVSLPKGIDPDSIKASYRNGVLEVTMKAPSELTTKKVPITVH